MDPRSSKTTLHVVTMPPEPDTPKCENTYTCGCPRCNMERAQRVVRGHQPRRPLPLKRAA